jgi:hypothetical protein
LDRFAIPENSPLAWTPAETLYQRFLLLQRSSQIIAAITAAKNSTEAPVLILEGIMVATHRLI